MNTGANKWASFLRRHTQLLIPLVPMCILIIVNFIINPAFLQISTSEKGVLSGYPVSILKDGAPLMIIVLGMTLVTAASGGQDISVGALAAIGGATFYRILMAGNPESPERVVLALAGCIGMTMVFGAFNGMLVSVFRIQPMIATLILFSCGRSFAYWIGDADNATFASELVKKLTINIPGFPIPTPILISLIIGIIFFLLFKFTNLSLYAQAVGINQDASRLNGINSTMVKWLTFVILGLCCAIAGFIRTGSLQLISYEKQLQDIEMDAILAVAIGGNSLGGGKYSMAGSVLGAYTLQTLQTTLDVFKIPSTDIKAYKAMVIILLVVLASKPAKKMIAQIATHIKDFIDRIKSSGTGTIPEAKEAQ